MGSRSPAALIPRRKTGYAALPFAHNGLFVEFVRLRALEGVRLSFRMPEELHRRLKLEACG